MKGSKLTMGLLRSTEKLVGTFPLQTLRRAETGCLINIQIIETVCFHLPTSGDDLLSL